MLAREAAYDAPSDKGNDVEGALQNRLREIREDRGMTQAELGKRIGTTSVSISRYEREAQRITMPLVEELAKALDCSPAQLLGIDQFAASKDLPALIPFLNEPGRRLVFDRSILKGSRGTQSRAGFDVGDTHAAITIDDDDMSPTLRRNDICILKRTTEFERTGLYAIDTGRSVVIRRVDFNPSENEITAIADNPASQVVWRFQGNEFGSVGRVIHVISHV